MKRILAFLIILGVLIGAFVTLRENFLNKELEPQAEETMSAQKDIDELNLPLIEVDTLNPLFTNNKQVSDVLKLVYEPLFDFDEKNKLVAKLASEWNEKDDLTWIIKLNKLATWHSGKDFSADDIIFSYKAIKNSENSVYKENIKNISSIEKIDSKAIQINLLAKDEFLLYKLSFPIIPKYYFENDLQNETKNMHAVGTGPYKYDAVLDNNVIKLIANTNWWKSEKFKLNKIYLYKYPTYGEAIKAFKSTEIDVISTTMSSWKKKFGAIGINIYPYENSKFETIIPNTKNSILNESSVRRMILSGINSENIIETIYDGNGKVSNCPIPLNSYLNTYASSKSYDVEKARQLLINAGWTNTNGEWHKEINSKKYTLAFELLVNADSEEKLETAKLIVENLKDVGVKIKIVKVKTKEYHKRIAEGRFELALATLNLNLDVDMLDLVNSASDKNFANYKNENLDKIISEINKDNLTEKFLEIQEIYRTEAPYIGMYYNTSNVLTNKSVKGNITPTSWNIYHGITGWCK